MRPSFYTARPCSAHDSRQVAFSPTRDEFMCSCGDDGSVRLWDVPKSTSVEGAPFKHYEQIMHFQVPNQVSSQDASGKIVV